MAPGVDLLHIVSRRFRTARTNLIVISFFVFWVGIVDLRRFAGTGHGMLLYYPRSTHHPRVCSLLVVRDRTGNLRLLPVGGRGDRCEQVLAASMPTLLIGIPP